jgi:S1-C subfamily serine protease
MEFLIGEPAIFALYARGADVFAGLRIKPYQNDSGETQGLQLFDILLDSFLERLGIEQGDVLVSIDETPIASINDVLAALERARDAASLTAGFLRDGEAFRLSLKARDGH